MLQPNELKLNLPVKLTDGAMSTTGKLWEVLVAAKEGNLERIRNLEADCPALIYAQYNYTPPIHFAVREGHTDLVKYLLEKGAHDPSHKIYPFQESLQTLAHDRGHAGIESLLNEYAADPARQKFWGENGEIHYERSSIQQEFEKAVYEGEMGKTRNILAQHPDFAKDETWFWGEGILTFAAKKNNREMIDLLMSYGAKVPSVLKWAQFYYFERLDGATYMMEKGMDPGTGSWHHVTLLHDMAQRGKIDKAELLVSHGAPLDPVDEEYRSTPLGMAARWGHTEMVSFLIKKGADVNKAGAPWSAPLVWARRKNHKEVENLLVDAGAG